MLNPHQYSALIAGEHEVYSGFPLQLNTIFYNAVSRKQRIIVNENFRGDPWHAAKTECPKTNDVWRLPTLNEWKVELSYADMRDDIFAMWHDHYGIPDLWYNGSLWPINKSLKQYPVYEKNWCLMLVSDCA